MDKTIADLIYIDIKKPEFKILEGTDADTFHTFEAYKNSLLENHIIYEKDVSVFEKEFSLELLSARLFSADSYAFQFRVNTGRSFQWYEAKASVCRRTGKKPSALVLHIKNLSLFLQEDDAQPDMQRMKQLIADCFQGFGKIFHNIILIDVNKGSYFTYNPYGNDYSMTQEIAPNGDYTNDNQGYGTNFIYEDDRGLFWSHTTLDAFHKRLKKPGDFYSFHVRHILNGEFKWTEIFCVRLGNDDTDFRVLYWVSNVDHLQQTLNDALLKADHSLEVKSTFLTNISHDMRTPLNGIIGFTDIALQAQSPEEKDKSLEKIKYSGEFLRQLINDTLDLSKMESNTIIMHPEVCTAEEIIRGVVYAVEASAEKKGVCLQVNTSDISQANIVVDRVRLQQLFVNLLGNAIKFTPSGGQVDLTVEHLATPHDGCNCKVTVQDTGIGMSKEFLPHAFEPFNREESESTPQSMGTGLGLSIAKQIVHLMGGQIILDSTPDKGTCFTIYLPIRLTGEAADANETSTDAASLTGKRILLCEDNEINRELAEYLLEKADITVTSTENGEAGVRAYMNAPEGYFDAILMDIRMPVLDGLEASERIRSAMRKDSATIPIIATTADTFEQNKMNARQAGMNAFLAKPLCEQELILTLDSLISGKNTTGSI